MRLHILILVTLVLSFTAFGFTRSDVSTSNDAEIVILTAPQGRAPCGLTVDLTVMIGPGTLQFSAQGAEGDDCDWVGMDVYIKMRLKSTGLWILFPPHSGTSRNFSSGTYNTGPYDRYKITADAYDQPSWHCTECEHGSLRYNHMASTSLAGDL